MRSEDATYREGVRLKFMDAGFRKTSKLFRPIERMEVERLTLSEIEPEVEGGRGKGRPLFTLLEGLKNV